MDILPQKLNPVAGNLTKGFTGVPGVLWYPFDLSSAESDRIDWIAQGTQNSIILSNWSPPDDLLISCD